MRRVSCRSVFRRDAHRVDADVEVELIVDLGDAKPHRLPRKRGQVRSDRRWQTREWIARCGAEHVQKNSRTMSLTGAPVFMMSIRIC
jgi:hypothetical protein